MAVYKDKKRGTWYVSLYYTDWTGKQQRKLKRGFSTKKEAQDWERHFSLEKASSLDMTFPQRKIMLRELVDIAIEQTDEFDAFVAYLRNEGLTVNVGRNITLQTEEMPFALRSGQLGENYSISAIKKRLDSKYDPFKPVVAADYYSAVMPQEMANIVPKKMKAYKDMTKEEKQEVVHLLRLGRNPWSEVRWDNWQMQKMADELKNVGYVYKLVRHYSGGNDHANTAMEKIIELRKQISQERKDVRSLMKEYKPITSIYQEMKKYMVRACTYPYEQVFD